MNPRTMRAALLFALLLGGSATMHEAQAGYGRAPQWCVRAYDGADDCAYYSFWQCRAAVWGTGGSCVVNPRFAGEEPPRRPRKRLH